MTSKRRHSNVWGAGRVAFLLYRDAIQRALNQGHSMAAIHRIHADALGIGYDQFVDYVAQYLERPMGRAVGKRNAPEQPITPPGTRSRESSASAPMHIPRQAEPEQPNRFHFDPMSVDKKNLI